MYAVIRRFFESTHLSALVLSATFFFAVHTIAYVNNSYNLLPWIDIPMHIAFGMWLALLFLYPNFSRYEKNFLAIFTIVMVAGLGWEVIEFLYDSLYALPNGVPPAQHGAIDTITDIINNTVGVLLVLGLFGRQFSRGVARDEPRGPAEL